MSSQREIDELRRHERLAGEVGGPDHLRAGELTVRERLDRLLDPGSFHEIGAARGFAESSPSGGLEAVYEAELDRAFRREQLLAEITTWLDEVRSPFRTIRCSAAPTRARGKITG